MNVWMEYPLNRQLDLHLFFVKGLLRWVGTRVRSDKLINTFNLEKLTSCVAEVSVPLALGSLIT